MSNQKQNLTPDEIEVRIWGFVVVAVTCILCFIVVALLYSVTFVTQPIKSMAPIDQAYTKMLNDIVLLIVGGIGGIMTKGVANEAAAMMGAVKAGKDAYVAPPVQSVSFTTPASWTPPPAPVNPPHYLESDDEREALAAARQSLKGM